VLAARDLQTGKPLWQKWIDNDVMSAPVVCVDEVYVVTFAGTLYKFALEDGEILMARRCHATSAPVVLDDGIYLTRRGDNGQGMPRECLVKLDRNTGKQLYVTERCLAPYLADDQTRAQYAHAGVSAAGDDSLADDPPQRKPLPGDPDYVSGAPPDTRSPSMRLVGRDSPQALQAFCGSRLASFNGGLFNWMGGQLRAVDPATGARRWSVILEGLETGNEAAMGDHAAAPPAVANGKLFVATRSGQLLRVDPDSGKITGRINLDAPAASQPVIDHGRVLVGTTRSELVCVDTGDPKLTGWNQWGGDAAHSGVVETAPVRGGKHESVQP
jgi:outer membrane protein assembly factor BamB